jgi:hypothetical protein
VHRGILPPTLALASAHDGVNRLMMLRLTEARARDATMAVSLQQPYL